MFCVSAEAEQVKLLLATGVIGDVAAEVLGLVYDSERFAKLMFEPLKSVTVQNNHL